jgi:uncharacterized protein CbrC (UPF0167 family)
VSFSDDLKQFEDKTRQKMTVIPRKVALEVLRRVVMRTPAFRARSW